MALPHKLSGLILLCAEAELHELEQRHSVAYVPFTTFLSAIDALEKTPAIPHRFDTSVWPKYSVAIQSQLLGALRFLGLVDAESSPTAAFRALVRDKVNRKSSMRKILESSYAKIVKLGLTTISPREFDGAMRQYGMKGETHKKAISFFLRAANYAELPMSPLLRRKVRAGGPRRRGRISGQASGDPNPSSVVTLSAAGPQPISKTIRLRSGGSVTLNVDGSFLEMATNDRNFVFGLIDKLQEYEKSKD
jgi:hypothetical protein